MALSGRFGPGTADTPPSSSSVLQYHDTGFWLKMLKKLNKQQTSENTGN
jgi:hypothetical protein